MRSRNRYNQDSPSEALFNRIRYNGGNTLSASLNSCKKCSQKVKFNNKNRFNFHESSSHILRDLISSYKDTYQSNTKTKSEANYLAIKDFLKSDPLKDMSVSYGSALASIFPSAVQVSSTNWKHIFPKKRWTIRSYYI